MLRGPCPSLGCSSRKRPGVPSDEPLPDTCAISNASDGSVVVTATEVVGLRRVSVNASRCIPWSPVCSSYEMASLAAHRQTRKKHASAFEFAGAQDGWATKAIRDALVLHRPWHARKRMQVNGRSTPQTMPSLRKGPASRVKSKSLKVCTVEYLKHEHEPHGWS